MSQQKVDQYREEKKNRKENLVKEKKQQKLNRILMITIAAIIVCALTVGLILTFTGMAKKGKDQSAYQPSSYVLPDIAGIQPTVSTEAENKK